MSDKRFYKLIGSCIVAVLLWLGIMIYKHGFVEGILIVWIVSFIGVPTFYFWAKWVDKDEEQFVNKYNLTRKEWEIILAVSEGLTSAKIAEQMNRSKFTIDVHRKNILKKTESVNMTEAITKVLGN